MKKIILDTNAYSEYFRGRLELKEVVEEADEVIMSPIVIGELIGGFKIGTRENRNRETLIKFLGKPGIEILDITMTTAEVYGEILSLLHKKGKPIPTNDVWIAAQAIENGAELVTNDRHFEEISGLRVWGV
jgi:tRNA(fMet)-specific endonuclease VapC